MIYMREKLLRGTIGLILCLFGMSMNCRAEIAGEEAFSNMVWEQAYEENVQGIVQSICATEDYIITIENIADDVNRADVVSAYYRNDVDKDGNPVEPYTLAKRVEMTDWEHGNGMAYNPNTHEIYVALYTNLKEENRGCLYVMDPDTLEYKRTIKVSDAYNILGIGYIEEKDQYVIQTNVDGGYSFKILDADFQVVEDLGEYIHTSHGNNFQDLAVSGDYIMNFPLTLGLGIGDYLNVYSISKRELVTMPKLDFKFENVASDEPESLCELEPGVLLAAVNVATTAGESKIRFYKTELPYYFEVAAKAENGKVSAKTEKVLKGSDYELEYTPADGYEFSELLVNGKKKKVKKEAESYVLKNIQADQKIEVAFVKAPLLSRIKNAEFMKLPVIIAGVVIVVILAVVLYLYMLHVKMERRRKRLRARRRRQRLAQGM